MQMACLEAVSALTKALSQPLQLSSSDDVLGSFITMVLKGKAERNYVLLLLLVFCQIVAVTWLNPSFG